MSNVHRRRVNSPFNKEQEIWIILEFGSVRNISTVRRNFRKRFKITNVKLIPQRNVFQRLVDRFIDQSDTKPVAKTGGKQTIITDELVERVKLMVETSVSQHKRISLCEVAQGILLFF
jgi:hypothetical protein